MVPKGRAAISLNSGLQHPIPSTTGSGSVKPAKQSNMSGDNHPIKQPTTAVPFVRDADGKLVPRPTFKKAELRPETPNYDFVSKTPEGFTYNTGINKTSYPLIPFGNHYYNDPTTEEKQKLQERKAVNKKVLSDKLRRKYLDPNVPKNRKDAYDAGLYWYRDDFGRYYVDTPTNLNKLPGQDINRYPEYFSYNVYDDPKRITDTIDEYNRQAYYKQARTPVIPRR